MLTVSSIIVFFAVTVSSKIHHLILTGEYRRNVLLTSFGYDTNGTLELQLKDFAIPDNLFVFAKQQGNQSNFSYIGFTLSRGKVIADGIRSKPHVCQLKQRYEGYDAVFFLFNSTNKQFNIIRTGALRDLPLCPNIMRCSSQLFSNSSGGINNSDKTSSAIQLSGMQKSSRTDENTIDEYKNKDILSPDPDGRYSFAIRFNKTQRGKYYLIYHNCFNYVGHPFNRRAAVDFTVDIIEKNLNSYLSAGDIVKPHFYLYMSGIFAFAAALWVYSICQSNSAVVYRVHHLMTALVLIKSLSLFFHGVNFYFVSLYGHQREVWAVVYYITHLLKGALLFGTIILIGTGYTFFKNFLSDRDRKLVMIVLPLQVVDNVAMVIIEESEFAEHSYQFWFQIFIFIDIFCCMTIILPIVWSMRHLQEGARSDGKAAFNLEKLVLFRHFYLIVISYIYLTRVIKFFVEYVVPFDYEWVSDAVVEISTLFFFLITGHKFRPQERNPYLKLAQDVEGEALTQSGVFANVTRVKRIQPRDELCDNIPGGIGGTGAESDDSDAENIFPDIEKQPLTRL